MNAGATSKRYGVILCDPPWRFETYSAKGLTARSPEARYATAPVERLATEMPVADKAAPDCALFMWTVDSHLAQGIELMGRWGFTYKTIAFNWVKTTKAGEPKMSLGLWTRKESEICLLGTRGKPKRKGKGVRQVVWEQPREHSRKPDLYGRIEALVEGPYIEMNARQRWGDPWDAWGDEVDKFTAAGGESIFD